MNAKIQVPEGFLENAQGAFVPASNVKEIDKLIGFIKLLMWFGMKF